MVKMDALFKMVLRAFVMLLIACKSGSVFASVIIKDVVAQQRGMNVDIAVRMAGAASEVSAANITFAATNSITHEALQVSNIAQVGEGELCDDSLIRRFVWHVMADLGDVKIDDIELSVALREDLGGVQLWENGPYWAECNVGASKPEEYGYYFWWGDTVGYKRTASNDGWLSVDDGLSYSFVSTSDCPTYKKSNSQLQSLGYIDQGGNLTAAHDAATAHLGALWRMPTNAEFAALGLNCDSEWTMLNGVCGRIVKGRGAYASKYIFFPAAGNGYKTKVSNLGEFGFYWSSTPYPDNNSANFHHIYWSNMGWGTFERYGGLSVRPVRDHSDAGSESFATTHFAYQPANGSEMYIETIDGIVWRYSIVNKDAVIGNGDDVRAIDISTAGDISIPSMLGGCPVIKINDSAFEDCALLTSIKIPSSVMGIGDDAFSCCSSIVSLVIPASVVSIGEWAFDGCSALESITIPQSVTSIGEKAFAKCRNLTTVRVKKGDTERVKNLMRGKGVDVDQLYFVEIMSDGGSYTETINGVIYRYSISNGEAMITSIEISVAETIAIPSMLGGVSVTAIGSKVLNGETEAECVIIPKTITSIGVSSFCGESKGYPETVEAWGVKRFIVAEGNLRYCVINGMLYDSIEKAVIAAEVGISGNVELPSDCISVGDRAFKAKHLISDVVMPSTLTQLGYKAFSECSGLTKLDFSKTALASIGEKCFENSWKIKNYSFPKSLTRVGSNAFASDAEEFGMTTALTTVYVEKEDAARVKELMCGKGVDVDQLTFVEAEVAEIVVNDVNGTITLPDGTTEENVSIKIMVAGHDIRPYINLPVAVGGIIDLSAAVVKPEVAAEAMDITKGAEITLSATNPTITTAPTKPGLTYTLVEGATIESMGAGASKLGDGAVWTPEIKVKGGASAFYSIKVTK